MKKNATFSLSEEAIRLLAVLAANRGISRTAVLELLIREATRKEEKDRRAAVEMTPVEMTR